MEETKSKYLLSLSEKYRNRLAVKIKLTELNAKLNLPKGTEHFMSDLHGEAEAFLHIRRNASGVIRNKITRLFSDTMSEGERAELATLIYYPEEKIDSLKERWQDEDYVRTAEKLLKVLSLVGKKYQISDFSQRIVGRVHGFESIIEQIVWGVPVNGKFLRNSIITSAVQAGAGGELICALAEAIRNLVVDRIHIVGDIFDRGQRPDLIIDTLMGERVDIEWGNHDVLWMGAAAGSEACCAAVLHNCLSYANLDALEFGYGISLRPLAAFAEEVYGKDGCEAFLPKGNGTTDISLRDRTLIAKMSKAAAILRFKTEGAVILRNPSFQMEERLLLQALSKACGTVRIDGNNYPLKDTNFPTVDERFPYSLTDEEQKIIDYYKTAFCGSKRLREHISFLYRVGGIYKIYNGNLLFHGCVPLEEDGSLMKLTAANGLSGRELMDFCDRVAREGYFSKRGSEKRQFGEDFLWYLGVGKNSPLLGKEKMATFERSLLTDEIPKEEKKNAYFNLWDKRETAEKILAEFGLFGEGSHIVNGHIPQNRGGHPIKAGGKLIVIDGGFCSAYHGEDDIAGYTLIYNAEGMRLCAHAPFKGREDAIENNGDILSDTVIFETKAQKLRIRETDLGREIREEMYELLMLLKAYESGKIPERG